MKHFNTFVTCSLLIISTNLVQVQSEPCRTSINALEYEAKYASIHWSDEIQTLANNATILVPELTVLSITCQTDRHRFKHYCGSDGSWDQIPGLQTCKRCPALSKTHWSWQCDLSNFEDSKCTGICKSNGSIQTFVICNGNYWTFESYLDIKAWYDCLLKPLHCPNPVEMYPLWNWKCQMSLDPILTCKGICSLSNQAQTVPEAEIKCVNNNTWLWNSSVSSQDCNLCALNSWQLIDSVPFCFVNFSSLNYTEGAKLCRQMGSRLFEPTDLNGNSLVASKAKELGLFHDQHVYIGINDLQEEGRFVYASSGVDISFSNWELHNPDDQAGTQDCAAFWYNDKWDDFDCHYPRPFICEQINKTD